MFISFFSSVIFISYSCNLENGMFVEGDVDNDGDVDTSDVGD